MLEGLHRREQYVRRKGAHSRVLLLPRDIPQLQQASTGRNAGMSTSSKMKPTPINGGTTINILPAQRMAPLRILTGRQGCRGRCVPSSLGQGRL